MSGDDYRICTGVYRGKSKDAFLIERAGARFWIPRSLIHGADDLKVESAKVGEEFTFRLLEWKAEELGLA